VSAMTPSEARACHAALRDWMEDFSHENGSYQCLCCICEQEFIGHKRRVVCRVCAAFPQNVPSQVPSE
jgi:hypothetical protein